MPFLILAAMAALVALAYVVGNAVTDGMYAARGKTPPRIKYRAERDAAKAERTGNPTKPRPEGGSAFKRYWANLWRDSWEDANTRRADRRADRLAAYRKAITAGRPAREAAREAGFGALPRVQTATANTIANLRKDKNATDTEPEEAIDPLAHVEPGTVTWIDGQRHQWTGTEWVYAEKGPTVIANHQLRSTPTTEGNTAMTTEAVNYETTLAAYETMLTQLQGINDRLAGIDTTVTEMQASAEQITAAGSIYNLPTYAVDGAQDVLDHLGPDELHSLMTRVDNAVVSVTTCRDYLISEFGDYADKVAHTGIDGAFVNA